MASLILSQLSQALFLITIQFAALGVLSRIMKECRGITELVQMANSMDLSLRLDGIEALSCIGLTGDRMDKELIFQELTASSMANLICDPEPSVQLRALFLLWTYVADRCTGYTFNEGNIILYAVGWQLRQSSEIEIWKQGMNVLICVASRTELHKNAVMKILFPPEEESPSFFVNRFLRSHNSWIRRAATSVIVHLTEDGMIHFVSLRIGTLRRFGIVDQIKGMVNDSCEDVKFNAERALKQILTFGDI